MELKLMEKIVAAECCPETLLRVKESGGRVVCDPYAKSGASVHILF